MYKYKTKDGSTTGVVPGIGVIVDGFITSPVKLESGNLELVTDGQDAPIVGTASQQNPEQPATAEQSITLGVEQ